MDGYAASVIGGQLIELFPRYFLRLLKIALAGGLDHSAFRALDLVRAVQVRTSLLTPETDNAAEGRVLQVTDM